MPTIGYIRAAAMDRKMSELIEKNFPAGEERENFLKLHTLSMQAGGGMFSPMETVITGTLLSIPLFFLLGLGVGLATVALTTILYWFSVGRMKRRREQYHALLSSNPIYWEPMEERLRIFVQQSKQYADDVLWG